MIELGDSPTIKFFSGAQPDSLELPDESSPLAEIELSRDESGEYSGTLNVQSEGVVTYFGLYDSTGKIWYRKSENALKWSGEQYMRKGLEITIDNLSFTAQDN